MNKTSLANYISRLFLIITTFVFLFINNSYARFATLQDADTSYDFYNKDISINEDGTYEETVEFQITLLREQARSMAAKFSLPYNGSCESIEIIEAKSILDSKEYPVTKNLITDKEIDGNKQGFDDYKQISLSFPKNEVGASIYLKYKKTFKEVPVKQEFFTNGYYGYNGLWKKSDINIDSKIALKIQVNDPHKNLSVKTESIKDKPNYFYKAQIKLVKPIINYTINEVSQSSLNSDKHTYFTITSLDDWQTLGNKISAQYTEILEKPLPTMFSEISEIAAKEKNTVDQINKVTTLLNEKIEYFGSWQSINGKFVPQDFNLVAKKQSGDCKDFAAITTKILNSLGYKANMVLVLRGAGIQSKPDAIPNAFEFNHAMVRAVAPSGKTYWIDPTNSISMADGLFADIAEKYALVIDNENSAYEQIPEISEEHAKVLITDTIQDDKVAILTVKLLGEKSTQLTAAHLYLSNQAAEDWLYNGFVSSNIDQENRINTVIPKLTSRVVTPIDITLQYKDPNMFSKTNLGRAYSLNKTTPLFLNNIIKVDVNQDINDLYLDHPRTLERKTIFKNIKIQNLESLNFNLENKFVSLSRQSQIQGNDTIITDKAIIHKSWIENSELKSEEFKKLLLTVQDKVLKHSVVLPISE